ncbi:hypothetical protein KBC75_00630 [Candidatus Shapirobacteria bacterium]|nr:hypothetical protein [Candidatus Shapirobacteria bacterium]
MDKQKKSIPEKVVDVGLPKELTAMLTKLANENIPNLMDYAGFMMARGRDMALHESIVELVDFGIGQFEPRNIKGQEFLQKAREQLHQEGLKLTIETIAKLKQPNTFDFVGQVRQIFARKISTVESK